MDEISVNVLSIPTDDVGVLLQFLSGVIVPLGILGASIWFNKKSEARANGYAKELWLESKRHDLLHRFHEKIGEIYKVTHTLARANSRRRKLEERAGQVMDNDDQIMKSKNSDAIQMQKENLRHIYEEIRMYKEMHAESLIEMGFLRGKLSGLVSAKELSELDAALEKFCDASPVSGKLTDALVSEVVDELNSLSRKVEVKPELILGY